MENGWLKEFIYNPLGMKLQMTSQQKEIINDIEKNRFNYYLKSRQIGFTELLMNYISKKMITETDTTIIFVCYRFASANNLIKNITSLINFFYPNLIKNSQHHGLTLFNGNSLKVISSNLGVDQLRGYGFEYLIFDECFNEEILSFALPCLNTKENSRIILGSSLFVKDFANFVEKSDCVKRLHYSNCSLFDEDRVKIFKKNTGDAFKYEMDLNVDEFVKNNKPKEKSKILQFRVDNGLENKILERLIECDISFSEYIRNLIIKDLK